MTNQRLLFLDVIRSISIFLIIFFHYNCATVRLISEDITLSEYYKFAGNIGVSMFFILSGASLKLSSSTDFSVIKFYKKRLLTIFPLFWTVYILFFIVVFFTVKPNHFEGLNPLLFIFTIIGIDGFLLYKFDNFYLIGEWFLGCLLILYAFFPIIRFLFNKNRFLLLFLSFFLLFFLSRFYSLEMPVLRFPLSRLFEFVFGMYFIKVYHHDSLRDNYILFFLSLISIFAIFYFNFEKDLIASNMILGALSFVCLAAASSALLKFESSKIISFISHYSFAAFLVHHLILVKIVSVSSHFIKEGLYNYGLFFSALFVIYLVAFFIQNALNYALEKI